MIRLSVVILSCSFFVIDCANDVVGDSRCESMRIPWCRGAYDFVMFPNFLGHKTQEEAYFAMHKLWPLIQSGCSADIGAYLCRLYAPQCPYLVRGRGAEYVSYYQPEVKPPCEDACLRVKMNCKRVLNEHGIEWPAELECDQLRNKDCDGRPTVEVKPTQMPSSNSQEAPIDWSVETISVYRTTTPRWKTVRNPTTSTAPTTTTSESPRTTSIATTNPPIVDTATSKPPTTISGRRISTQARQSSTTVSTQAQSSTTVTIETTSFTEPEQQTTTPAPVPNTTAAQLEQTSSSSSAWISTSKTSHSAQADPVDSMNGTTAKSAANDPVVDADTQESSSEEMDGPEYGPESSAEQWRGDSSDEIRFRPSYHSSTSKCEHLTIPSCQNFGYNATNIDEEMQNLAAIQIFYFSPLLEVKCSDSLQGFLCAAYVPPCRSNGNGENVQPPCRDVCESARTDCAELMEKVGFRWPDELDCRKYPDEGGKCIPELVPVEGEYEEDLMPPSADMPPLPARLSQPMAAVDSRVSAHSRDSVKCELIEAGLCADVDLYNETRLPNVFSHQDQSTASLELLQYQPLIDVPCAKDIRLFLCSVYFPPCPASFDQPNESTILPCRSLCESVKEGCTPLLVMFRFDWPRDLNCDQFPDDQESNTCVRGTTPYKKDNNQFVDTFTKTKNRIDHARARLRAFEALKETAPLNPSCESLSPSSVCHGLYETIFLPTVYNHISQEEAALELSQYKPLLNSKCSEYLKPFLCSLYAPVCTVLDHSIPPCREVCVEAKKGCEPVMNSFGFEWPTHFDCDKFPTAESGGLCMDAIHETTFTTEFPILRSTHTATRPAGHSKMLQHSAVKQAEQNRSSYTVFGTGQFTLFFLCVSHLFIFACTN